MNEHQFFLLTTREAAAYLRLSVSWLNHDRVCQGRIPFIRIGRLIRYRKADLDEFIRSSQRHSTSDPAGAMQ
ncbi:helix-turn-helix domain-containing protein [Acidithiobacillus caldus]|uniref:Helix-turn-helix domain-containing protein n=1 Tax=Acidithiobacillus caldus TaxID=33059 RepID=A0A1E7YQU0_9PROT|nr:helix-turn-helix domain-containing protein [Acidithiobacillus caldus]OFC38308.1 hypothetical protein BAE27_02295 [Acidithiobacillus caldus]OFC38578.1 hypothetical protein BAE28_05125 [Acidithiobacillus caldus]OFC41913.1 hypothetical protein BAE29_01420 [Acidithiobacillus caldus]